MLPPTLLLLLLLALQAGRLRGACVEVDSDSEAVVGGGFKLGCISCKMRAEVRAQASVRWSFRPTGDPEFSNLFFYEDEAGEVLDERFLDRLVWRGSNRTRDLQDGSIYILNVTYNDSGTYQCVFDRRLMYDNFEFLTNTTKVIQLHVVPQFSRGMASILSEVMMYVSIVGLQLWLLVEMIYCYRKISAAGEEALRESATDYLAIASESKENCAAEPPPE